MKKKLSIDYDVLVLKGVHQAFVPITSQITKRIEAIPLECLDELTEAEELEYETDPLKFSPTCYEFTCIYQGLIKPDIKIGLTYYLYVHNHDKIFSYPYIQN